MVLNFLLVAGAAYLAGMFGSLLYAAYVYGSVPKNPGGENKMLALVFLYMVIAELQIPKVLVSLAASGIALALCSSACSAAAVASLIGFAVAGVPFAYFSHRRRSKKGA